MKKHLKRKKDGKCGCDAANLAMIKFKTHAMLRCISKDAIEVKQVKVNEPCPACALVPSNLYAQKIDVNCTRNVTQLSRRMVKKKSKYSNRMYMGQYEGPGDLPHGDLPFPRVTVLNNMNCRKKAITKFMNYTIFGMKGSADGGGASWTIDVPIRCRMEKTLTCWTTTPTPQAYANDDRVQTMKCTRTSSITPQFDGDKAYVKVDDAGRSGYGNGGVTEPCPMNFKTAAVKAAGLCFTDMAIATNLVNVRKIKGQEYCQRFAVQF